MRDDYRRMFREVDPAGQLRRALDELSLRHIQQGATGPREMLRSSNGYALRQELAITGQLSRVVNQASLSHIQDAATAAGKRMAIVDEQIRALARESLLESATIGQRATQAFAESARSMTEKFAAIHRAFDHEVLHVNKHAAQLSRLTARESAALTKAQLQMNALQKQLVDSMVRAPFESAVLKSFDAARARWLEAVRMPASTFELSRFAAEAQVVFRGVSDLLRALPAGTGPDEVDEEEGARALALARERIEAALDRPDPLHFVRAIAEILGRLKKGAAKAAPPLLEILMLILRLMLEISIDLTGSLLYDKVVAPRISGAPQVQKQLVREAKRLRQDVPRLAHETRVVVASGLIVRSGPGKRYAPVGRLAAGDLVSLEGKRTRSWSLVVFRDGDVVLRGWVFSRYLKPLRGSGFRPRTMPSPPVPRCLPPSARTLSSSANPIESPLGAVAPAHPANQATGAAAT